MKKTYYKTGDYLTDHNPGNSNVKVELDLKNYATKEELKNITHVDTSNFALKTDFFADLTKEVQEDFNSLKTKVDKIETDNDNLESIANKNDAATKDIINTLKTKVDGINLSNYVLKSLIMIKLEI